MIQLNNMLLIIPFFTLLTVAAMLSTTARRITQIFIIAPILGVVFGGLFWSIAAMFDNNLISLTIFGLMIMLTTTLIEIFFVLTHCKE